MKKIILMVILIGTVYSQCNQNNWQEYYNSENHNMVGCNLDGIRLEEFNLEGANLSLDDSLVGRMEGEKLGETNLEGASLINASLEGIISKDIVGTPRFLPKGWSLVNGTLSN